MNNHHILNYSLPDGVPNGVPDVNYGQVMENNPELGNSLQQTTQSVIGKQLEGQQPQEQPQVQGPMPVEGTEKQQGSW